MDLDENTFTDARPPPEQPVREPKSDVEEAAAGRTQSAIKTSRAVMGRTPDALAPVVQSEDDYKAVLQGHQWTDPNGGIHTKPYAPLSNDDYRRVPEGAQWVDPKGGLHTKETYEDISFSAQTLYNIAANDSERKKALEYIYPGGVKNEPGTGDVYVEDQEGKKRKPRGFMRAPFSTLAAGAAPTAGAVAGEIGGVLSMPATGPVGPVGGAILGGTAGQAFNDVFLKALGIYDRTAGEEALGLGLSGGLSGAGSLLGRMFGMGALGVKKITTQNPRQTVRDFLEVIPEAAETAKGMAEKGLTAQPISPWAPGAPHLINMVEVFDNAFHKGTMGRAADEYYQQQTGSLLGKMGVQEAGDLANPTAAVETRELGSTLMNKARERVTRANENLKAVYEQTVAPAVARKTEADALKAPKPDLVSDLEGKVAAAETQKAEKPARIAVLEAAQKEQREAATGFVNAVYQDIFTDIDQAVKVSGAGRNSGELWKQVATKFQAARKAFGDEATGQYEMWAQQYGAAKPGTIELATEAEQFILGAGPEFKNRYPDLIQKIARMAGETNAEGKVVKPPTDLTMAELHDLRTQLRYGVAWDDLRSDWLNGALKKFAGRVDETMGRDKPAHKALGQIDDWYRENGAIYDDKRVDAVIKGLRGGEPADPKILYDQVIREGRSDLNKKIENIVGPNLWRGVQAADADALMQATKTEIPGQVDGRRFINGVLDRYRDGTLESIHGKETAAKWLKQVQNLKMLEGEYSLPVSVRPGDRITDTIERIAQTAQAIEAEAKADPLKLLNKELAKAKQQWAEQKKAVQAEQQQAGKALGTAQKAYGQEVKAVEGQQAKDPLNFLFDESYGAAQASDRILKNEDLIFAAENMFGRDSPEFAMLQQTWAHKLFSGTIDPQSRLAGTRGVPESVQRMMFPGVSYDEMKLLAKEMGQLTSAKSVQETSKSMAATSKVENPQSLFRDLPPIARTLVKLPGAGVVPRYLYGAYYGWVRNLMSRPATLQWITKGMQASDPAKRKLAKEALAREIRQFTQAGGRSGAGAAGMAESQYQAGNDHSVLEGSPP